MQKFLAGVSLVSAGAAAGCSLPLHSSGVSLLARTLSSESLLDTFALNPNLHEGATTVVLRLDGGRGELTLRVNPSDVRQMADVREMLKKNESLAEDAIATGWLLQVATMLEGLTGIYLTLAHVGRRRID